MSREEERAYLLGLLMRVIQANDGEPAGTDNTNVDAEALANKCFLHAASAMHLATAPTLPVVGGAPIDVSSISVLVRAATEAMLVFRFLFVHPEGRERAEFRYDCWRLKDLQERRQFPNPSPELREVLEREEPVIAGLSASLKSNPHFKELSAKQQKNLLSGKGRHLDSWTQIGADAGLGVLARSAVYSQLCSHAHSGLTSVVQLRLNPTTEQQVAVVRVALGQLSVVLAYMIESYSQRYERSREVLDGDRQGVELVALWCGVGAGDAEDEDATEGARE
jgi:hypothetical protein